MMVMGLAPVVGIPLPLVSFGGSAVMTVMMCLGLLMALERQQRTALDAGLNLRSHRRLHAMATRMLPARPRRGARSVAGASASRHGRIAQLVEQLTLNQRVLGSSPSASTIAPFPI